ncbi:MAG TPA: DUF998 domain-containing protein [Thermoanaerobaculia bacterium]|nr:DUF998 domain-containing protein [Thermoanaerobaculia bacterium]
MAAALWMGVAVPILYFGSQIVAAPFYPGYNFMSQVASELGSDRSTLPVIFNTGVILTGIAAMIASTGFLHALRRLGTTPVLAWLTSISLLSTGLGGLWAGSFPLPDPRHNPGLLGLGTFLMPLLLAAALWKRKDAGPVRTYLLVNAILFIAQIPIMSGMAGLDTRGYEGLLQRVGATIVYLPIGVVAYFLWRRAVPTR